MDSLAQKLLWADSLLVLLSANPNWLKIEACGLFICKALNRYQPDTKEKGVCNWKKFLARNEMLWASNFKSFP